MALRDEIEKTVEMIAGEYKKANGVEVSGEIRKGLVRQVLERFWGLKKG